jgi:hypothetical protein
MILTAHQPTYLPWLGLFHKIAIADCYVSYDHVALSRYDYVTRNTVRAHNGPCSLIVPIRRAAGQQIIKNVIVDYSRPWPAKHWRTIYLSYHKAPYFSQYAPFFEDFYKKEWASICEMNNYFLAWTLRTLGIQREIVSSSSLDISAIKSAGVLEMSTALGANCFIFGTHGKKYADVEAFHRKDVAPIFQEYIHPTYPQVHGDFVSHLSIIDLLFNCGPQSFEILMSGNMTRTELEAKINCEPHDKLSVGVFSDRGW